MPVLRNLGPNDETFNQEAQWHVPECSYIRFAAFGPVERDPHRKVFGEIFEPMLLSGGNEDERTRFHRVPLHSVKKGSGAARDEINLVARVRLLRVLADGCVHFNRERAVRKNGDGEIARRRRAFRQCFAETHEDSF